jgi:hypothetical protein
MTAGDSLAFADLCQREPRLRSLARDVQAVEDTGGPWFCANDWWCADFKPRLVCLVGWRAEQPELRTSEVYDVAYATLYRQLPDCRNCHCIRLDRAMGLRRTCRTCRAGTFQHLIPSRNGTGRRPRQ